MRTLLYGGNAADVRQSVAFYGVIVRRLAKWFGCLLVWLALSAQIVAPAIAAMAELVDPLAHFAICTSDGPVTIPNRHGPSQQPSCCDTLCQLAHAGHTLLTSVGLTLSPLERGAATVEIDLAFQAAKLKPTFETRARAPPDALLVAG